MKKHVAEPGVLYVTATPIGNASDITVRALDVLRTVDSVACEDTRVTSRLLSLHGISVPLIAYHEHNAAKARPGIIRRLKQGNSVAVVSDAGTPLVSDPGYKLVRACIDEGVKTTVLPGASAVLCALLLSGLPSDRFLFQGFLPPKSSARKATLLELSSVPATLVFMESPRRLISSLADMAAVLGPRPASVSREITKLYEETHRGSLSFLAELFKKAGSPKGEIMIVVGPPDEADAVDEVDIDTMLESALVVHSVRDAVHLVTETTGFSRQVVYKRALALSENRRNEEK